jgi:hypothetical protein
MHEHEKWNEHEIGVATIGLSIAAACGGNERTKLTSAVTYWLEQAFKRQTGMDSQRFPTIEEMKRFSIYQQQQQLSKQTNDLVHKTKATGKKKRKRSSPTINTYHSDPTKGSRYLLVFPLTEAMINGKKSNGKYYKITNQTLKAYKKVFKWNVDNNKLRTGMVSKVQEKTGEKPDHWTNNSTVDVNG